ncbi:15130_t:CDS:1 [Cetraspora pellucida]|uniref:15130_t:CDS:1 n=1 Tax=Cetraspora pellucida TaxID=1433469 RepID=A0A9N9HF78_9GLOM|nr:15130_t:CDS:1 [Cetraspora pellucida]
MNQHKSNQSKKRAYVTTACQNCRRRRIRCSGEATCFECVKGHVKCEYAQPTKKRGRKPNKLIHQSSSLRDQALYEHERILELNHATESSSQNPVPIFRNNFELSASNFIPSSVENIHNYEINDLSTQILDPQPNTLILDNFANQAFDNFHLFPHSSCSTLFNSLEEINLEFSNSSPDFLSPGFDFYEI